MWKMTLFHRTYIGVHFSSQDPCWELGNQWESFSDGVSLINSMILGKRHRLGRWNNLAEVYVLCNKIRLWG